MNISIKNKAGILTAVFAFALITGLPSLAFGSPNSHANAAATDATTGQANTGTTDSTDSKSGTKLADAKLKVCKKREAVINNKMHRIAERGQKQLDLFSSIADKTEKFYTNKGKTLSNYDALVADVNAKKAAAQATVDTVKADSVTFKCDGTDPKGAASSFKDALKSEISALKDYKTSVKNLIVGVKSVQGTTSSADNSAGGTQ